MTFAFAFHEVGAAKLREIPGVPVQIDLVSQESCIAFTATAAGHGRFRPLGQGIWYNVIDEAAVGVATPDRFYLHPEQIKLMESSLANRWLTAKETRLLHHPLYWLPVPDRLIALYVSCPDGATAVLEKLRA